MNNKRCPITGDTNAKLFFSYDKPPDGEVDYKLNNSGNYKREIWQYAPSGHFISNHSMDVNKLYKGQYVDSTYKDLSSMQKIFNKIISLPSNKSDNFGRFNSLLEFSHRWFNINFKPNLLDIGSGLGVFPYIVEKNGWECTAIDPDNRSIQLINQNTNVKTICGDFMELKSKKKYDIITLNKVLEHVDDPIEMLSKSREWLNKDGFIYLELPDGEMACLEGKGREEFFIEHLNIFSMTSTSILVSKAGFKLNKLLRLKEPSSKYTIRAFLSF